MSNVFVANSSFEPEDMASLVAEEPKRIEDSRKYDDWLLARKVRLPQSSWEEGELGDSCCFGTRTVEVGMDCVWKLHGGVH
jgi:hypothetical protein